MAVSDGDHMMCELAIALLPYDFGQVWAESGFYETSRHSCGEM